MVLPDKSRFIALVALLALFFAFIGPGFSALSVSKGVFGNQTIDFGEQVRVRVNVVSDSAILLERLEDPLPAEFSALNLPPSCSFSSGTVTCPFGYEANNFSLEYSAVAVGSGQKVVFLPSRLYYKNEDGLPETKASNEIDGVYYVGRALLNVSVLIMEVDGEETLQPYLLPGSLFKMGISVRNAGALPAEDVKISISQIPGWNLTSGKISSSIGKLSSGESQGIVATFRAPSLANFTEGAIEVNYTAKWKDSSGRERESAFPVLVFLSRPDVSIERKVSVKWRRTEVGELQSLLETILTLKNRGTADAIVSLSQGVPGTVEKSSIVSALKLSGGEEKTLSAVSVITGDRVTVPGGFANYSDARANSYPGFSFASEEIKIEASLWARIYQLTDKFFPIGQLVALGLVVGGLIFLPSFGKNVYVLLGLGAIVLASVLLLASTVIVWFGF